YEPGDLDSWARAKLSRKVFRSSEIRATQKRAAPPKLATLPTTGRKPEQVAAPVVAKDSARTTPPPRSRSIARSNALEDGPPRPRKAPHFKEQPQPTRGPA